MVSGFIIAQNLSNVGRCQGRPHCRQVARGAQAQGPGSSAQPLPLEAVTSYSSGHVPSGPSGHRRPPAVRGHSGLCLRGRGVGGGWGGLSAGDRPRPRRDPGSWVRVPRRAPGVVWSLRLPPPGLRLSPCVSCINT